MVHILIPKRGVNGRPFISTLGVPHWGGILIQLARKEGIELYNYSMARMYFVGETLWFDIKGSAEDAKCNPDTVDCGMYPVIELGVQAPGHDIRKLAGTEFFHKGIENDEDDSCDALIYYFEHEPIINATIKISESQYQDKYKVIMSFMTNDIVDWELGPIRVNIDALFEITTN